MASQTEWESPDLTLTPHAAPGQAIQSRHFLQDRLSEREFFIDNLLVRIHLIIEMILVDRPCAMGVRILFSRYLYLPS